jgi:large subunit ribosomal protein L13
MEETVEEITIIDGENTVLGRLASNVAKRLLCGERIVIVNAEKVVVSGEPRKVIEIYKEKHQKRTLTNPKRGPFWPKQPDRFVKRTIRGMLPRHKMRGREAYKRLRVYIGIPDEYVVKKEVFEKISEAEATKLKCKKTSIKRIAEELGWKGSSKLING